MIYSKERGWAFVHVPKNAGTCISAPYLYVRAHYARLTADPKKAELVAQNRKKLGINILPFNQETHHNKWEYWSKFQEVKDLEPVALLRNPWDRCLSLYTFNLRMCGDNLNQEWGRLDHSRLIRDGFKTSWMPGGFFVDDHGRQFEYNKKTGRAWAQGDQQNSWLPEQAKWFRIEDEIEKFCAYTGIEMPKSKQNVTVRGNYRDYYDDELAERISILFKKDIALGNYSF